MVKIIFFFSFFFLFFNQSYAQNEYYLTLRSDKVNLRQGPSFEHPIRLIYKKKFLPVLVQDQSYNFRKIRDHENNTGWIHISQLSKKKAAINIEKELIMFKRSTVYSNPVAILKKGRLIKIKRCKINWCKGVSGKFEGWLKKDGLWGRL